MTHQTCAPAENIHSAAEPAPTQHPAFEARAAKLRKLTGHQNPARAALATAALQRLQERRTRALEAASTGAAFLETTWYGGKTAGPGYLDTAEVAKLVRAEITMIRTVAAGTAPAEGGTAGLIDPIGDAPAGLRISVTTDRYSGGSAIELTLSGIPEAWKIARVVHGAATWDQAPALTVLVRELSALVGAYVRQDVTRCHVGVSDEQGRLLVTR